MANKRVKKKQIKKSENKLLIKEGRSRKQVKKLKGTERKKVVKYERDKVRNRERQREISKLAKEWGLSPSKYNSWKKLLPAIEEKKKEMDGEQPYLLIFYQDFTGETDSKFIFDFKRRNLTRTREQITRSIIGWLQKAQNQAFLGRVVMRIVPRSDRSATITNYQRKEYVKIYDGQGKELTKLLTAIETIMVGVYDRKDRDRYLKMLLNHLRSLPYEKAHKNADEIQKIYDLKETAFYEEEW